MRLRVDDGGNGIGSDGFEWSDLRLEGPGGTVPLTKAQQYTVGYGEARYDAKSKIWQAHAVSSLVFDIPKGDWNLKDGPQVVRLRGRDRTGGRLLRPAGRSVRNM